MAEHKRLRPQGDRLESHTSPHKDVSKRTREKHKVRETIRKLRKQFEAYANAQADMLRVIATNKNVKNWTLWRGRPPPKRKKETTHMGGTGGRSTGLPLENERALNGSDV
jgi:hypothetical protein